MIRLHVTAEGSTEERFVNKLLCPHLSSHGVFTDVRCVLTSRDKQSRREYRGGFRMHCAYPTVKKDIMAWISGDNNRACRFTTMFDLYALPADFPGKVEANRQINPYEKVKIIEKSFSEDIGDHRFIPYIQLHEFEALIFSEPGKLAIEYFGCESAIANLVGMLESAGGNPERLDDGYETCPSRRIIQEIPEYDKANGGIIVAGEIGLSRMRSKCQHFNDWLTKLEELKSCC